MANLSDIVNITITLLTGGITQAGFGVPMILSHIATWPERIRFYTDPVGVSGDFATTTPEYKAASAIFSQTPAPSRIAIGRASTGSLLQKFVIGVAQVLNNTKYQITVGGTVVSYTSDGTATNDEIATGLQTAITVLAPAGFAATTTGSVGSFVVQVLGAASGNWLDITTPDPMYLTFAQTHADPGVATDLAAILLQDNSWYHLVTLYNSQAYVAAAAAWVEGNLKLYTPDVGDNAIVSIADATPATDIAHALKAASYNRTGALYHPQTGSFAGAAWPGACLPLSPGSETWKFKTLAGVPVYPLTVTQQNNAQDKRCNLYIVYAGRNITTEGYVASGQYIDTIRFRDWLQARIQERIALALFNSNKIPYTDEGIAIIQAALHAQLQEGVDVGGIVKNGFTITAPLVANASPADKAARILRNMAFTAQIAGAIHKLFVNGQIVL